MFDGKSLGSVGLRETHIFFLALLLLTLIKYLFPYLADISCFCTAITSTSVVLKKVSMSKIMKNP